MTQSHEQLDLLIIGAGPAGLSAAAEAARAGLSYLVVEKGLIADTVFHYPVGRTVFSTPNELELREGALKPCREKPTREELLSHYVRFALDERLRIHTEEEVTRIARTAPEGFDVRTTRRASLWRSGPWPTRAAWACPAKIGRRCSTASSSHILTCRRRCASS